MTGVLAKKFQDRLIVIPKHLQYASSNKSLRYGELLCAIDLMDKEKAIRFTKSEFEQEYGLHGVAGLKGIAKKTKVPFLLRVIEDKGEIIIFKNDLHGVKK